MTFGNGLAFGLGTTTAVRAYHPQRAEPTGLSPVMLDISYDTPADVDAIHATAVTAGHRSQLAPFDAF